ncbi:hypothetical protein KAR91_55155 [Candidatus Pacearchaeota archaeon]|nr:hypothetical protein [Candidatus Pacearchaeota archaeon]
MKKYTLGITTKRFKVCGVILILAITGCSPRQNYKDQVEGVVLKWEDALKIASSTSKIALSEPVANLQKIKREAEKIQVRGKNKDCHDYLLAHMDLSIDTFLAFMKHDEALSSSLAIKAADDLTSWGICYYSKDQLDQVKQADQSLAQTTLRILSTAAETYAIEHYDNYPSNITDLITAQRPYIDTNYCGQSISGFTYKCKMSKRGYVFLAIQNTFGSKVYKMETGGIMTYPDISDIYLDEGLDKVRR